METDEETEDEVIRTKAVLKKGNSFGVNTTIQCITFSVVHHPNDKSFVSNYGNKLNCPP